MAVFYVFNGPLCRQIAWRENKKVCISSSSAVSDFGVAVPSSIVSSPIVGIEGLCRGTPFPEQDGLPSPLGPS